MSYNVHEDDPLVFNPDTEQDIDFLKNNLKNNNEKLPSFLEFYSSFPTAGKQGILGLLKDHKRNRKYVYKISQYLNFIVNQEYNVMEDLNSLRDYCPHFCKSLGKFKTKISKNFRKEDNPFENCHKLNDSSIENTISVIHHSEFFIGLSSGLSWLSWAIGKHVVMISNFTEPDHEFTTNCTRIINTDVCNGCWNNPS